MAEFEHTSVLERETIELLSPRPGGRYVDGTLGGGGHAERLLEATPDVHVVGVDRDPSALEAAGARLARFGPRVTLHHGTFAELPSILGGVRVDGIVLDLGVSSPQLDRPERGFSFGRPGPLDMRMDPTSGPTALDLIDELDEASLADLIKELGEERYGKKIARSIKEARQAGTLTSTTELAAVVARAIPIAEQRRSKIHPATRTFQALRIGVNAELDQLERFLGVFPDLLAPGGRCAVISFHSLEDRLVKNRFRDLAWTTSLPANLAAREGERVHAVVELVTRKAVVASDEEIAANPRARSARLRVCERTPHPHVPATASGLSPIGRSRFHD